MDVLTYHLSAASSLVTQVNRTVDSRVLTELDQQLTDPAKVNHLIMKAISASKTIQTDRPDVFVPRLWLAAYQYMWEQGKTSEATDLIASFFGSGGKLNQPVLNDYLEMMRSGFSVRSLYEMDHC
jgi:hypothetical protein